MWYNSIPRNTSRWCEVDVIPADQSFPSDQSFPRDQSFRVESPSRGTMAKAMKVDPMFRNRPANPRRRAFAVGRGAMVSVALWTAGSLLSGCNGAFWGNLIVLGMTFGIFMGTLSLGRTTTATKSSEASTSLTSRS